MPLSALADMPMSGRAGSLLMGISAVQPHQAQSVTRHACVEDEGAVAPRGLSPGQDLCNVTGSLDLVFIGGPPLVMEVDPVPGIAGFPSLVARIDASRVHARRLTDPARRSRPARIWAYSSRQRMLTI